jgi:hypothetical protein
MRKFPCKSRSGIYLKQQFRQIYRREQLSDPTVKTVQRRWLLQFLQAADGQGRIFTVIADMDLRISFKAGCDCFPGLIQLNGQLMYAFMSIGGMSQRSADRDSLSLPFFPLQQLLAGISPAIAVFEPDVPASQCILKAFQQTK